MKKGPQRRTSPMRLTARESASRGEAIVAAFLADESLKQVDVARRFGISRERVRQLLAKAGVAKRYKLRTCVACSARFHGRGKAKTCSAACAATFTRSPRGSGFDPSRALGRDTTKTRTNVVRLRRQGLTYGAIATKLRVHASTVGHHLRRANMVGLFGTGAKSPKSRRLMRERERRVRRACKLFDSGFTTREVATRLGISRETAKLYLADRHFRDQPKPHRGR